MIKLGNSEYVKTKGDFKLDSLHVNKYAFEFPTNGQSKQSLTVEFVPFAYLDDGSRVYDLDTVYKIYIPDVDTYLQSNPLPNVIGAYFATEQGLADILNDKLPLLQATFVSPNQGQSDVI
jgi:hypothetical protein